MFIRDTHDNNHISPSLPIRASWNTGDVTATHFTTSHLDMGDSLRQGLWVNMRWILRQSCHWLPLPSQLHHSDTSVELLLT